MPSDTGKETETRVDFDWLQIVQPFIGVPYTRNQKVPTLNPLGGFEGETQSKLRKEGRNIR